MARSKSPLSTPSDKSLAETPNGSVEAPEVLTLDEAAACLRVGQAQVLEMITGQGLPARKFGTQWRILKAALLHWLSVVPEKKDLLGELGKIKDDPNLQEMLHDIYARRGRPETSED